MNERKRLFADILVNAILPYATYLVLTWRGLSTVAALAAGAAFPIAAGIVTVVRERRVQPLGMIVIVAAAASAVGAVCFTSPFLALAKGSLITGAIGLLFLLSLLTRRPLVFHLVATARDPAGRERIGALWDTTPDFRRLMRRLTAFWATGLLAEASARLALIPLLPIPVFLPVSEIMWITFFALMTAWSWQYGRRRAARMDIR